MVDKSQKKDQSVTVIVKVTSDCNLACKYCYMENSSRQGTISIQTVETLLEEVGKANKGRISEVIWHGGEPLRAGLDFYENVAYIEYWLNKKNGYRFSNSIQTNGILVDEKVVEFCLKHDFRLGFSLDGPEEVHGRTRINSKGSNSFKRAIKGLQLTKKAGVSCGAIVVINKLNISDLDKIYSFFKEEDLGLKLNPIFNSGSASKNIEQISITPLEYSEAMISVFDKYYNDGDFKRTIEPFDTIMGNVSIGFSHGSCVFSENCQENFISVGPEGDVYPCGRFDGLKEFYLGNIKHTSLSKILKSRLRKKMQKRGPKTVEGCKRCDYSLICNSGCMSNGYSRRGNYMDKDYYCSGYKKLFNHIQSTIDAELRKSSIAKE